MIYTSRQQAMTQDVILTAERDQKLVVESVSCCRYTGKQENDMKAAHGVTGAFFRLGPAGVGIPI